MPRVFFRRQSDGSVLNDPLTAPVGRNVLTISDVRAAETYKCVAVSKLGSIAATTEVQPDGREFRVWRLGGRQRRQHSPFQRLCPCRRLETFAYTT